MKNYLRISFLALVVSILSGVGAAQALPHDAATPLDNAQAQANGCRGVVVDVKGEPIIGATVQVKGTTNGTQTDFDGKFALDNVKKGDVLLIKFMGYKDQEMVWNGQALTIKMVEDAKLLDEVVVVGYGTQKKVNVTGSVSTVDAKQLEARPVQNVVQALQGAVPGLNMSVGNNGGTLNSTLAFSIRGNGTIGTGSSGSPLVLIDGVEGDMNSLNPNDVANISVLKDAASSSIYGARGAFGVILIQTKSGRKGSASINYIGNVRFNSATQVPEMVNSLQFANYFNDAQRNQNGQVVFDESMLDKIKNFLDGKYTDPNTPEHYGTEAAPDGFWQGYNGAFASTNWFNEFYKRNVPSYEHSLSVSGGSDKITYLVSAGLLDQNGLLKHGKDEFMRYTLNAKLTAQLYDWFSINYYTKWSNETYSRPQYLEMAGNVFFHNIARRWPTNPAYVMGHPMRGMEITELENSGLSQTTSNEFTNQLSLIFEPIKDWHINIDGSFRKFFQKSHRDVRRIYEYNVKGQPVLSGIVFGGTGAGYTYAGQQRWFNDYYQFNVITDYSKQLDKHYFKVMGGMNTEFYHNDWMMGEGDDLITDNVPYLGSTQNNPKVNDGISELAIAGFFGRLNYNYDQKYLFEANLRYDGSSRFVGDKRWGLFPSFSLGWNIARESFFEPLTDKISSLKLRASWGQLGNNSLYAYYPFYQTMPTGNANSGWLIDGKKQNTAGLPGIVSSMLSWERVESWNTGFDFVAFRGKLSGTFDYYHRYTYDMVGPAPTLPAILGATPPRINNADLLSYGWELQMDWKDQIGDFSYGVGFNLSDGMRKILRYPNETGSLSDYYAGMHLGEIWGYESIGLAQDQAQMDEHLKNNMPNFGSKWSAGDVMYKDLNGDGKVTYGSYTLNDHGDFKIIGNSTPRYNYGINMNMAYKGIDFSIFMQGVGKRDYWANGPYFWGSDGDMWQSTVFKEHMNYWREDNKNAYYPRPIFGDGKNQQRQSRYLQDASYMRIKNIQLGYTLPKDLTQRLMVSKLRMYVSVDNLATFTKMSKIFDPEALGGSWGAGKLYPLQRTFSIGCNINFN